ncbi:hypothetical protein XELAEV_18041857mg [Xenopus laevis]|uniref:IF rod domain-containing protein n=1 Tax=Xenopus laevis TaxID=8355 RepID=A0A974C311_XENLA|nr:hypothetical protein XELAEV_18041857mg [Xenopus laevis]
MASLCFVPAGSTNFKTSAVSLSQDGAPCAVSMSTKITASPILPSGLRDDKEVMQNLNSRLATYLEKVGALEKSNKQLESQIQQKILDQKPLQKSYSAQLSLIKDLQNQIAESVSQNTKLEQEIDNNKLAADDFHVKWSTESAVCQSVEKDIRSLRKVKEDHDTINISIKVELEGLKNEWLTLQNSHAKDLEAARESVAKGKVEVEVDAVKGPDLNLILSEIRLQYEDIMKKNKEEADALFQSQCDNVNMKMEKENQEVQSVQNELREHKSKIQGLQLELNALYNQVKMIKQDLDATELRYQNEQNRLQNHLEYEALLRIKETLEAEITEYRRLLEEPEIKTKKIIKIVTQTIVDGKLVNESSEVEEYENAENKCTSE